MRVGDKRAGRLCRRRRCEPHQPGVSAGTTGNLPHPGCGSVGSLLDYLRKVELNLSPTQSPKGGQVSSRVQSASESHFPWLRFDSLSAGLDGFFLSPSVNPAGLHPAVTPAGQGFAAAGAKGADPHPCGGRTSLLEFDCFGLVLLSSSPLVAAGRGLRTRWA